MITKAKKTSTTNRFLAQFSDIKETAFSGDSTAISQLRKYAISYFEKLGIPTRKTEDWKYTPISKELNKNWTYRTSESKFNFPEIANLEAHELVVSNNDYKEGHNPLPENVPSEFRNVLNCVATTVALVAPSLTLKAALAPDTVISSSLVNVPDSANSLLDKPVVAVIPIPFVSKSLFLTV